MQVKVEGQKKKEKSKSKQKAMIDKGSRSSGLLLSFSGGQNQSIFCSVFVVINSTIVHTDGAMQWN